MTEIKCLKEVLNKIIIQKKKNVGFEEKLFLEMAKKLVLDSLKTTFSSAAIIINKQEKIQIFALVDISLLQVEISKRNLNLRIIKENYKIKTLLHNIQKIFLKGEEEKRILLNVLESYYKSLIEKKQIKICSNPTTGDVSFLIFVEKELYKAIQLIEEIINKVEKVKKIENL